MYQILSLYLPHKANELQRVQLASDGIKVRVRANARSWSRPKRRARCLRSPIGYIMYVRRDRWADMEEMVVEHKAADSARVDDAAGTSARPRTRTQLL